MTPIEQIFFRASKISLLCSGISSQGITAVQMARIDYLQGKLITPKGITEPQRATIERIKGKEAPTPKELAELQRLELLQTKPEGLTDAQAKELEMLLTKLHTPPQLTEGGKSYVRSVWLELEKGFTEDIDSKEVRKGREAEEASITLLSDVLGKFYKKNATRQKRDNITGECDIIYKEDGKTIIRDIKSSYSPRTFMDADLKTEYYWQGVAYMWLYGADRYYLDYCLVNTPLDIYEDEYKRYCFKNNIIDDTLPKYRPLIERFNKRHFFTEGYTQAERVKSFMFERDERDIEVLRIAVGLALEYYQTLTLNRKPNGEETKSKPRDYAQTITTSTSIG